MNELIEYANNNKLLFSLSQDTGGKFTVALHSYSESNPPQFKVEYFAVGDNPEEAFDNVKKKIT